MWAWVRMHVPTHTTGSKTCTCAHTRILDYETRFSSRENGCVARGGKRSDSSTLTRTNPTYLLCPTVAMLPVEDEARNPDRACKEPRQKHQGDENSLYVHTGTSVRVGVSTGVGVGSVVWMLLGVGVAGVRGGIAAGVGVWGRGRGRGRGQGQGQIQDCQSANAGSRLLTVPVPGPGSGSWVYLINALVILRSRPEQDLVDLFSVHLFLPWS